MKKLILFRHAKSSWKDPDLEDLKRPLNKRGKRDAPFMGAWLKHRRINPDLIISSPAKRALSTAKIVAKQIGYPKKQILVEDVLYFADINDVIKYLQSVEDQNTCVSIFGHNPGLTELAEILTETEAENIPTSGICSINFEIDKWKLLDKGSGILEFLVYPKKFLV